MAVSPEKPDKEAFWQNEIRAAHQSAMLWREIATEERKGRDWAMWLARFFFFATVLSVLLLIAVIAKGGEQDNYIEALERHTYLNRPSIYAHAIEEAEAFAPSWKYPDEVKRRWRKRHLKMWKWIGERLKTLGDEDGQEEEKTSETASRGRCR